MQAPTGKGKGALSCIAEQQQRYDETADKDFPGAYQVDTVLLALMRD